MRRARRTAAAVAGALLLAGCGVGARAVAPTWLPKPSFNGEGQQPNASAIAPQPGQPGNGSPSTGSASSSSSGANRDDPAVVATKLTAPDAIAILPDNTALVGERTTGRILQVQPVAHKPVKTVRTLTGLSTAGGGGLLDLALSPNYIQDNLIFAYLTTKTDNRVVAFTRTGAVTPVLTGIPRGTSDNTGRIAFGGDGQLYVGTSDAGQPRLAADPNSLAGKVLRVTDIGRAAPGNPTASSPVFTSGHHVVAGLCLIADTNTLLEVEPKGTDGLENVNVLTKGDAYGWPTSTPWSQGPLTTLPSSAGGPGGCAVLNGNLYVTSLDGKALLTAKLTGKGGAWSAGKFGVTLKRTYGRLRTVVAAADGALWLTTSNRDGLGTPVAADERVLRIVPAGGAATYPG
jgi:glucose/arabinose dehydrogenase